VLAFGHHAQDEAWQELAALVALGYTPGPDHYRHLIRAEAATGGRTCVRVCVCMCVYVAACVSAHVIATLRARWFVRTPRSQRPCSSPLLEAVACLWPRVCWRPRWHSPTAQPLHSEHAQHRGMSPLGLVLLSPVRARPQSLGHQLTCCFVLCACGSTVESLELHMLSPLRSKRPPKPPIAHVRAHTRLSCLQATGTAPSRC